MRVFCPSCQEPVTIADDLAGKATFCPLCKAAFTAPTLFTPPPAPNPPPPTTPQPSPGGFPNLSLDSTAASRPPQVEPTRAPDLPTPRPTPPAGPGKTVGFVIPPELIVWMAPAFLLIAVFLTFFSWNGAYPGGYDVYTQGPWLALIGSYSTDPVGEKVFKLDSQEGDESLKKKVGSNLLMLPYLLLLGLTTVLAIAFTVLPKLAIQLPPPVQNFLPWRMGVIAALGVLLVLIIGIQSLRGFSLENALLTPDKAARESREKATTPEEIKKFEIEYESAIGKYGIRRTSALRLTMLCHIIVVLGSGLALAIARRGDRPAPRIEIMW
jgi:hypothetical protein